MNEGFYTCSCFITDNIFVEDYNLHVRHVTEHQFRADYQQVGLYLFILLLSTQNVLCDGVGINDE